MDRWIGKLAIVTGASSGIGAAIAEKLVESGCQVVGLARRLDRLQELEKKLTGKPGKFHPFKADVTIEDDILEAFKWATGHLGPVHILINNSGVIRQAPLISGETAKWREVYDTNVIGLCICTREAVQNMRANNIDGHIVHINSIAGHKIMPGNHVYSSSKYAVTNLTEVLRNELRDAKTKIKITSISPGFVDTEIVNFVPGAHKELLKECPALQSEDIANGVLYTLSTPPHVQVHEIMIKPVGEPF